MNFQHIPVMLNEVLAFLAPQRGGIYVDCTLGGGGHAETILVSTAVRIIAFDQDADALAAAKKTLANFNNIVYVHDNFKNLKQHIKEPINGILFDLGVSSWQIDEPTRGFSWQKDGPLDMRMDKRQKLNAKAIVNYYNIDDLAQLFFKFGEERFSRRIAKAVVEQRKSALVTTTLQLKAIVEKATPGWRKRETLSRIFQALRIAVNQELESLPTALAAAIDLVAPGGRIVVLSYHSLEDRIVKQTFKQARQDGKLKILTKKPVYPTPQEITVNPRARSARLRAGEKA